MLVSCLVSGTQEPSGNGTVQHKAAHFFNALARNTSVTALLERMDWRIGEIILKLPWFTKCFMK